MFQKQPHGETILLSCKMENETGKLLTKCKWKMNNEMEMEEKLYNEDGSMSYSNILYRLWENQWDCDNEWMINI